MSTEKFVEQFSSQDAKKGGMELELENMEELEELGQEYQKLTQKVDGAEGEKVSLAIKIRAKVGNTLEDLKKLPGHSRRNLTQYGVLAAVVLVLITGCGGGEARRGGEATVKKTASSITKTKIQRDPGGSARNVAAQKEAIRQYKADTK